MKNKARTPEERLLHAYEHAFLCVFVLAALAFTALYLYLLGFLGHKVERAQFEDCAPWAYLSVWGLAVTAIYVALRLLFVRLSRPALGEDTESAYSKKITL